MIYPPAAPTAAPIAAPVPLCFEMIAPPTAPAAPPITAPCAALLHPFFCVPWLLEVEELEVLPELTVELLLPERVVAEVLLLEGLTVL